MKTFKRMTWIFIVSALTALLAILSGYLQYREGLSQKEEDLKKEVELKEAYKQLSEKTDIIATKSDEIKLLSEKHQLKLKGETNNIITLNEALQDAAAKNAALQEELLNYTRGGNEVPALTGSVLGNHILVRITNPSDRFPMLHVKVKSRENILPDIGTLYPNVGVTIETLELPEKFVEEVYYYVIWYNNRKSLVVDLEIKKDENGNIHVKERYLDENDEEFIPDWKLNPKDGKNRSTYNPRLHS